MDKLRLDSGLKKIEVNDNGDYITVNLSDGAFFDKFNNFLNWFYNKQDDVEKKCDELKAKYPEQEEESVDMHIHMFGDSAKLYRELCDEVCVELDKLFGERCCQKVFPGVESPGFELIIDFIDNITPLLQKYAVERNQKINARYNRNRKGARSK